MSRTPIALIGCGGMGRRHLTGLGELHRSDFENVELVAVCDLVRPNAEALADEAKELLGARPRVFERIGDMVAAVDRLEGVSITTEARAHHVVALECFRRGLHVMSEKPLGLTIRACNAMLAAAGESGRVLSTAENYRRDPINRLIRALIDDGAIGTPRQLVELSTGGGNRMVITPWRHSKTHGGVTMDVGVHHADILRYYLGEAIAASGQIRLFETVRYRAMTGGPGGFYAKWEASMPETTAATAEDAEFGLITFANGAVAQYTYNAAGFGQGLHLRTIHGSRGSIASPGDRNGRPVRLFLADATEVGDGRILDYAPSYRLTPAAAQLFGGERVWTYSFPFPETDRKILALEYHEFADCVQTGRSPEVTGEEGRRDVALIYAICESALAGRAVTLDEVEAEAIDTYQRPIDESLRLV